MFEKHLKIVEQIAVVFVFAVIVPMSISGFIINNIKNKNKNFKQLFFILYTSYILLPNVV